MHSRALLGTAVTALSALCLVPLACTTSSNGIGTPIVYLDANVPVTPSADGSTDGSKDGSGDAAPPPPAAGGSGAFGIVSVGGKQKLYLPQQSIGAEGTAIVTVVDVGIAGNGVSGAPALIKDINLPGFDVGTASGGDSSVVVIVSTENRFIHFIDPQTDTLVKTIELDQSFWRSGFSGGGGFVTGVAVDSTHHRAILSVWDGYQIVDLTKMELGAHIQAPPAENFGFDSVHGWILAPFYSCSSANGPDGGLAFCDNYKNGTTVVTDGLNVIDLADNTVYTYNEAPEDGNFSFDPARPLGSEPDSASADPLTGVIAICSEGEGYTTLLDMTKASWDKANKTFTVPTKRVIKPLYHTGVSIEPNTHLGFWEDEGGDNFAVADISPNNANPRPVEARMPEIGDAGFGWSNMGDPHGVAVASGILDGKPYGFLVNSSRDYVARIDLQGVLASKVDATELDGTATAPYVTYLDTRHKP